MRSGGGTFYRPGDTVVQSGIYRAVHVAHRLPHLTTVLAGQRFPTCRKCGNEARFELYMGAEECSRDRDLAAAEAGG